MSYTYITNRDSNNFTPAASALATFGYPRVIEGITIHWWGDPNQNPQFNNIVDYLCRAGGNTSAHFIVTGTNRQAACIISPSDVAWHSGSAWGNARTIGIEVDPRGREEDFDTCAELIADIRSAYGDVPLYWHNYFVGTTCPGVYQARIDELDQRSYTKQSNAEWGQVTDKNPKTPQAEPAPVQTPTTTPVDVLFKLTVDGKQVAAYSTEANAWKGYVQYGKTGTIKQGNKNVTAELVAKFTTPSPTTQTPTGEPLPDTGKPVVEKDDYADFLAALKENTSWLQKLVELLKKIFKIGE